MAQLKRGVAQALITLLTLTGSSSLQSEELGVDRRVIQYQINRGNTQGALNLYQQYKRSTSEHDFQLLRDLGISILDEGSRSRDTETLFLSCFGGGVALNDESIKIYESCLDSPHPNLHMVAIHFLATLNNEKANQLIIKALSSPYLPIRFEAAYLLLKNQHLDAFHQLESLYYKTREQLHPLFPQLLAMVGSKEAIPLMRRFLSSSDEKVRIQAILNIAKYNREEFLENIRNLSTQSSIPQQEVCAFALGHLRDSSSIPSLMTLSESPHTNIKIASYIALNKLGIKEVSSNIHHLAEQKSLLAIHSLSEFPTSKKLLLTLMESEQLHVRFNAALSLLELKEPCCVPTLKEILVIDEKDYAITINHSYGSSLSAWKVIPSSHMQVKQYPFLSELSTQYREQILSKIFHLNEKEALDVAETVFESNQKELIPSLVKQLEQLGTTGAIDLLLKYHQKPGAPLTRNYCTLALYKLGIDGHYEKTLIDWLNSQKEIEIFSFRPLLPWQFRQENTSYQLTPKETSRLMIETYEALSQSQSPAGIDALVEAIIHGNEKNRYVLAGLLIRGIE